MVDGVSSIDLIEVLHDTQPDAGPRTPPRDAWQPRPVPGSATLLREALTDQASAVAGGIANAAGSLQPATAKRRLGQLRVIARTVADTAPMALRPPPATPFNRPISASRQFAWLELPFDEVTAVRKRLGATVNDMVLAILSGGLGRYMRRKGYETDGVVLRALCPVSMRRADQHGALGNLVSMVVAPLEVGIADPLERLRAGREEMERLKRSDQAGGLYDIMAAVKALPAPLFAAPWRIAPRTHWPQNITSTNVAGPRAPLYLGAHELLHWYPVGVQWTNNALFLCTLSYREHLTLGLVADPTIVPDVWEANEDLRAAYAEIEAASRKPRARARRPAKATGSSR
jgi:WS/DGAT/MGAT family acyltransferase